MSVVVPNLNSPIVDKTIESIKSQTWGLVGVEIIVVGVDIHGLVPADGTVKFLRTDNPVSPAAARNLGIKASKGEIVFFLDSDCTADPEWMQRIMAHHLEECCVVSGAVSFPNERYWTLCDNLSIFHEHMPSMEPGERKYLPSTNLSLNRKVVEEIGDFDETLATAEDLDLTIRAYLIGYPLLFEPEAVVLHLPERNSFLSLMKRSHTFGMNSTRVRLKYPEVFGMPRITRNALGMLILSPLIAFFATSRVFINGRGKAQYWQTFPVVFLAKLAWCFGAARHMAGGQRHIRPLENMGG